MTLYMYVSVFVAALRCWCGFDLVNNVWTLIFNVSWAPYINNEMDIAAALPGRYWFHAIQVKFYSTLNSDLGKYSHCNHYRPGKKNKRERELKTWNDRWNIFFLCEITCAQTIFCQLPFCAAAIVAAQVKQELMCVLSVRAGVYCACVCVCMYDLYIVFYLAFSCSGNFVIFPFESYQTRKGKWNFSISWCKSSLYLSAELKGFSLCSSSLLRICGSMMWDG